MSHGANMGSPCFTKAFKPEAAIAKYLIATIGTGDNSAIVAATGAAFMLGIGTDIDRAATDPFVDLHLEGIVPVIYGGTVAVGSLLTATAGKATVAVSGNNTIGVALVAGVLNDIGLVFISRGKA